MLEIKAVEKLETIEIVLVHIEAQHIAFVI